MTHYYRKKPHDARGATGIPDENIGGHFHTKEGRERRYAKLVEKILC